ncbi:16S rRNA (guanine1516-G2)-methyltransferase RsmJ [Salinisphaera dokdonensis CL-ES53]|uniref:Ribosomal RNA small subunit methyltransferase J n=2 Tax=Salinisphaera TaxID=180541 RepID=A0ABV2AVL8_9GAMM
MPPALLSDFPLIQGPPADGFYLQYETAGLTLRHAEAGPNDNGLCLDLLDGNVERRAAGGRKSPLAKAIGLRRHPDSSVLDTTCGLGRDAATLAALGCTATTLERHPVLFALVEDARERAAQIEVRPHWLANWSANIRADAINWLAQQSAQPGFDVIYIDPMFESTRRKARPQKALAWLGELVGGDTDVGELLDLALARAGRQVVVKQHARSKPLAPPDRSVEGKAIRFDIFLVRDRV